MPYAHCCLGGSARDRMEEEGEPASSPRTRKRTRTSSSDVSNSTPRRRLVCNVDDEAFNNLKDFVRRERGRHLDRGEKLDILLHSDIFEGASKKTAYL